MAIIKAVILGDTECGKTSFTQRWTTGSFPDPEQLKTTVGAAFDTKKIELPSGKQTTLSLWDFGGQMRFIETLQGMIRGAKIGLLFFDVSKMSTLDSLFGYWIPRIEKNSQLSFVEDAGSRFLLVGNKIDLLNPPFDNVEEEMDKYAKQYGIKTQLISAKTGIGIESLDYKFMQIIEQFAE